MELELEKPKGAKGYIYGQWIKVKKDKVFAYRCGQWVLSSIKISDLKRKVLLTDLRGFET